MGVVRKKPQYNRIAICFTLVINILFTETTQLKNLITQRVMVLIVITTLIRRVNNKSTIIQDLSALKHMSVFIVFVIVTYCTIDRLIYLEF